MLVSTVGEREVRNQDNEPGYVYARGEERKVGMNVCRVCPLDVEWKATE